MVELNLELRSSEPSEEYFNETEDISPHEGFNEVKVIADENSDLIEGEDDPNPHWRFCWTSEFTDDNPIMRTWKCKGSIKYIHYNCLKEWLSSKAVIKGNNINLTIAWKSFEWELCKVAYPYCLKYKNKLWNLVDLSWPINQATPYLILESLESEKNSSRTIHAIAIQEDKKKFQMGRGKDWELRINDISVSRKHAWIEYREDGFYIIDFQSKFGTVVLLSNNFTLSYHENNMIQIGKTIVTLRAKFRFIHPNKLGKRDKI